MSGQGHFLKPKSHFKLRVKGVVGSKVFSQPLLSLPPPQRPTATPTSAPENVSQLSSAPVNLSAPSHSTGSPEPGSKAWPQLKKFRHALNQVVGELGPVKTVVEGIVDCVGIYESVAQGQKEYDELRVELEHIFDELRHYFSASSSPAITLSIANICGSIQKEVEYVKRQQARPTTRRLAGAQRDADNVLACYRRMQRQLERLSRNANVSTWAVADQLATDNRLKELSPSLSACYNSEKALEVKRGACTNGTRMSVLAQMYEWASGKDTGTIYWMSGMAGTGKTTIAYSLCEQLDTASNRILGASFFCSRSLPECRSVGRIIPSIAYQLARGSQPFRYALSRVMDGDPDAHTRLPRLQFDSLIAQPLLDARVREALPENFVVVIDALDECADKEGTRQILEVLLTKSRGLPLKFIVSSRPEATIRDQMAKSQSKVDSQLVLHELDAGEVQGDIETYLKIGLAPINPSGLEIQQLVERAGVLFIYAATVIRYVGHDNFGRNPQGRLRTVLGMANRRGHAQTREIDELYAVILKAAFEDPLLEEEDKNEMKLVLNSVVCAYEPLSVDTLSGLLQLDDVSRVHAALRPLWSVLHVMEPTKTVTALHVSFPEYLLERARSGPYHCDAELHNYALVRQCFDCIRDTNPKFNICGLESSYILDTEVEDLEDRVKKAVSKELFYSSLYWSAHLNASAVRSDIVSRLEQFMTKNVLLWMEIMNLTNRMPASPSSLAMAKGWAMQHSAPRELVELIHDAWRLASSFVSHPISQSTPHLYISMLPLLPPLSPFRKNYGDRMQGMVSVNGTALGQRKQALLAKWLCERLVFCVAYSPDGTRIAIGGSGHIYFLDAFSGQLLLDFTSEDCGAIMSIRFSPDGTHIVSGSSEGLICIWGVSNGQLVHGPLEGHKNTICSVAFLRHGSCIVSSSADKTIRAWDLRTGDLVLGPLIGHADVVTSVAISSDNASIFSGSADKTIRVWDAQSGKLVLGPITGHTSCVTSISLSVDDTRILSGSDDCTVRIWDSQTGHMLLGPLSGHTSRVTSVSFSPDGVSIASGSDDMTIRIWTTSTGECVRHLVEEAGGPIVAVTYSPDNTRIISSSEDGTICIWDTQDTTAPDPPPGHTKPIHLIDISPDGTRLVSGSADATLCIWDLIQGGLSLGPLVGHTKAINSMCFSPDGSQMISCSDDKSIRKWDIQTGVAIDTPIKMNAYNPRSLAYSPNGVRAFFVSHDGDAGIWDLSSGETVSTPLQELSSPAMLAEFSPDGSKLVISSEDGSLGIWDVLSGQKALGLRGHNDLASSVAFSADGLQVVAGFYDKTIYLWNAQTGERVSGPLRAHTSHITSAQFSPDGTRIVSGSLDRTLYIWDVQGGNPVLGPLRGHTGPIRSVAFLPNNTQVASASSDMTIRVWDVQPRQILQNKAPNSPKFANWALDRDGWVIDGQSRRLLWVPPDLHASLIWPRNTGLSSRNGYIRLNFDGARIGEAWVTIYNPA